MRDDALRGLKEESPKSDPELRRYWNAGAEGRISWAGYFELDAKEAS
jgi:hypothetical protein